MKRELNGTERPGPNGAIVKRELPKARYRDIVGSSLLIESRNVARYVGVEKLYLKFEGGNPTGTQKDRISLALAEKAKLEGFDSIATASCGNFGAAIAYAAKLWELKSHIFIPKDYHLPKDRVKRMLDSGAEIHYEEGQYEDLVIRSSELCREYGWFNANPGVDGVKELSIREYAEISMEIFRELRRAPDYVFVPVGNGTTLAGVYEGFKKLHESGKIPLVPRIVATSTRRGNPIVKSYKLKSRRMIDLGRDEIRESRVNEPLTNWHSFDGQEALDAIYESGGFAEYASDTKMIEFARLLRQEEGLNVLPASASTLAVMNDLADSKVTVMGRFVAILTGRDFS
ncbi:MAG: pyridoxal-phosphate dependent enzyme [Candidatus Thorarchaeota archaeon]|nr:pyridoxal-phosphate dependent enzyme [Candidatus Thorarchaeota archaeon]